MAFISGCSVCRSHTNLFKCTHCSAVEYCSVTHSLSHAELHSTECTRIVEAINKEKRQKDYSQTRALLSGQPSSASVSYYKGHYRALRALVRILIEANTVASGNLAVDYFLELQSSPGYRWTSAALQSKILPVMLRLNRHQICYDYICWFYSPQHEDEDLENIPPLAREDLFEPIEELNFRPRAPWYVFDKSFIIFSVTYLKLSCLLALESLQNYKSVEGWLQQQLNYDVAEVIREHFMMDTCDILKARKFLETDNFARIRVLKQRVNELFKIILGKEDLKTTLGLIAHGAAHGPESLDLSRRQILNLGRRRGLDSQIYLWKTNPRVIEIARKAAENNSPDTFTFHPFD